MEGVYYISGAEATVPNATTDIDIEAVGILTLSGATLLTTSGDVRIVSTGDYDIDAKRALARARYRIRCFTLAEKPA